MSQPTTQTPNGILSRDVSWMYFNHRILQEAQRDNVPLLERLSFLGIYSNNLDEFFRVRVSAIRRVIEYQQEPYNPRVRNEAIQQMKQLNRLTKRYLKEFEQAFEKIKGLLQKEGIYLIDETQLNEQQANYIRHVYRNDLNSSTYPLMTSRGARLNDLTDSGIYLAVKLFRENKETSESQTDYALIELPTKEFDRFIVLPSQDGRTFILFLDDVVRFCLPYIFAGLHYDRFEAYTFKFTRDAEIELYSGIGEGLIEKIARGVKNRKKGEPVRFVYDRRMPTDLLRHVKKKLNIDRYDTSDGGSRYHNMKDLMSFPTCGRNDLRFRPQPPLLSGMFNPYGSTLELIRRQDLLLHYPYHSFSSYIRILREAALSPEVKSIKTTVYRLAKNSKVVKALICAARHGKRVTVMVELMARFDESSNINWSQKMQDEGIHVIFGVEGLKVHSKLTHISTTAGDVACISTGNFHEGNAKLYTDVTLCTANEAIVREVDRAFTFIEHPYKTTSFRHLLVAPQHMRRQIVALINEEIRWARQGKEAYILAKINHITDEKIIEKLYEASQAGVKMRFLVRGNCSIITGIENLSENIEIRGIIDRYLEHSRILIFGGGGREHYYIGSADWMPRNLDHRVEVYTPVYDPRVQEQLKQIIEFGLADNMAARIVDGSGANRLYRNGQEDFRSQERLYAYYCAQAAEEKQQPETSNEYAEK